MGAAGLADGGARDADPAPPNPRAAPLACADDPGAYCMARLREASGGPVRVMKRGLWRVTRGNSRW